MGCYTDPPIDQILPSELICDVFEMLRVQDMLNCSILSRRFFSLTSTVLKKRVSVLFGARGADLEFVMSLPSETYRTQHCLMFSRTEESVTINVQNALETSSSWKYPLAVFKFLQDSERFPINIETPFETFRTVLWDIWMTCPVTLSPLSNAKGGLSLVQMRKQPICKGVERIRDASFEDKPTSSSVEISCAPSCILELTFLPYFLRDHHDPILDENLLSPSDSLPASPALSSPPSFISTPSSSSPSSESDILPYILPDSQQPPVRALSSTALNVHRNCPLCASSPRTVGGIAPLCSFLSGSEKALRFDGLKISCVTLLRAQEEEVDWEWNGRKKTLFV
ncbi:uncharacterized protein EI90DRAFT_3043530 [Cantharellus anzutake]|uniref:uncharacterized protein n=1 Tax=Cantharellus anzutake TaxID=1750568 RepID=UPI0019060A0E|nr:uncharacterized protein EI90DRAFT_3043530 [Cantharellus anzutake]KAF8337604.1 hypothetical protein EI90DRAFT_3043530 [Cantharellus anzutake]